MLQLTLSVLQTRYTDVLSFMPFLEVLSLQSEKTASDAIFSLPGGLIGDLPSFHSAPQLRELYLGKSRGWKGTSIENQLLMCKAALSLIFLY